MEGIGDVCSFALMEPERPGDPDRTTGSNPNAPPSQSLLWPRKRRRNAKPELSLLNFTTQHPTWQPPPQSAELIQRVNNLVRPNFNIII